MEIIYSILKNYFPLPGEIRIKISVRTGGEQITLLKYQEDSDEGIVIITSLIFILDYTSDLNVFNMKSPETIENITRDNLDLYIAKSLINFI